MSVKISIPTNFRKLTQGQHTVELEAKNVREMVEKLEELFPGFRERLLDEEGRLKRYINIYHNGSDINGKKGLDTELDDGDTISIVPALAGG